MISTIKYKGLEFDVEGTYHKFVPSLNYTTPPIPESFEIDKLSFKDNDITELFDSLGGDWDEIERIVIDQVRD